MTVIESILQKAKPTIHDCGLRSGYFPASPACDCVRFDELLRKIISSRRRRGRLSYSRLLQKRQHFQDVADCFAASKRD